MTQPIATAHYHAFRDYLHRHTGLFFDDSKRYYLDSRLQARIRAGGHASFDAWFQALQADRSGAELQAVVNAVTINETYFLRESNQLDCMLQQLLPELLRLRAPGARLRIWSVPSSTGEEPYSIALSLLERWPPLDQHEVEICSSDIDTAALAAARQGLYSRRAVAHLPPLYLHKYFEPEGDHYRISRDLVASVEFSQVNLCDADTLRRHRGYDLVFCRNLLIYFDERSLPLAVQNLHRALAPGGFLCLGHSESITHMLPPGLVCRQFPEGLVYQKVSAPTAA